MSLLPSTTYQSPPRLGRGRQLNTILEEKEDASQGLRSDSEGDGSDSTVIGRPAAWNPALFTIGARKSSLAKPTYPSSPGSSYTPSPASSAGDGCRRNSARSSLAGSDACTVFSDDCPSLASDPTSFDSESSRSSFASDKSSSRNRYPALIIPRDSWCSMDSSPIKEITFGMSPATKIRLSPSALSALPRDVPAINAPPSLGDSSDSILDSPCNAETSAPVTPDMRQLEVAEGQAWGGPAPTDLASQPLEIALDDGHSVILSPAEAHSANSYTANSHLPSPAAFTEMIVSFPTVPGATPQDLSPLMPTIDELKGFEDKPPSNGSDVGVRLPPEALQLLQLLAGQRSRDDVSSNSGSSRPSKRSGRRQEMRERSDPDPISRPRSADGETPVSDYSFSQLSIPSPGGFFSSLQNGSRHTWCLTKSKGPSVPSTATAEMFYNRPWENSSRDNVVETVLTVDDDTSMTEGPPTAKQATFDLGAPGKRKSQQSEDDDLYGPAVNVSSDPTKPAEVVTVNYEYDEKYYEELKKTAGQNLDRTGTWLAAQTGYLSAILDSDPNEEHPCHTETLDDNRPKGTRRTVMFADKTTRDTAVVVAEPEKGSPDSEPETKEPIFHSAFQHLVAVRKRRDAFIHSSSRLDAIQALRVALPEKHISNLLGQHTLVDAPRPKYSGPFSQNPRQTGVFERTAEQIAYQAVEREQLALASIEPSNWQIDALRAMFNGRLLASEAACQRLKTKATVPLDDAACVGSKRHRILDLGGVASASWAWNAALEWPNVKVYTVITKDQARSQRPAEMAKPEAPANHRTISVPHFWQLPFRSGHFDVVSARSLHVLLKNNPVPGVPEIDEWDLTLRECMRVLKPGGHIDYMIMDSTIAHAGPRAETIGSKLAPALEERGLRRGQESLDVHAHGTTPAKEPEEQPNGFTGGWQSWRQGGKPFVPAPRPISEVSTISKIVKQYMDVEAVQGPVGSTQDVADLTGLLGARMWEEWLVKVRVESGREQSRWLEGVDEVIEEGKEHGSGWKVLIGWARKPRSHKFKRTERAEITVAIEDMAELSPIDESMEMGMIPMVIQE
ncbi:Methyltransferase domain-containing protein [Cladophialophora immunda]|nr:Methyltransferase domain-containing protein [Cladophialophora immunda]